MTPDEEPQPVPPPVPAIGETLTDEEGNRYVVYGYHDDGLPLAHCIEGDEP